MLTRDMGHTEKRRLIAWVHWLTIRGWFFWRVILFRFILSLIVWFHAQWEDKYFFIRILWIKGSGLPEVPHTLWRLVHILEEWTGWNPDDGIEALIFPVSPVVKQAEDLSNLYLGGIFPLKTIWDTFIKDPWRWVFHQSTPWNDLHLLSGKEAWWICVRDS